MWLLYCPSLQLLWCACQVVQHTAGFLCAFGKLIRCYDQSVRIQAIWLPLPTWFGVNIWLNSHVVTVLACTLCSCFGVTVRLSSCAVTSVSLYLCPSVQLVRSGITGCESVCLRSTLDSCTAGHHYAVCCCRTGTSPHSIQNRMTTFYFSFYVVVVVVYLLAYFQVLFFSPLLLYNCTHSCEEFIHFAPSKCQLVRLFICCVLHANGPNASGQFCSVFYQFVLLSSFVVRARA